MSGQGVAPGKAERAVRKRVVFVHQDKVIKIQEPGASRRERLRTMAGREVGRETGLFVVPEVVTFDDARGEIAFERLNLTGLRELLADDRRNMELVGRAAAALAAIHGQMKASDQGTARWAGSAEERAVLLHGDFGVRNIWYLRASDEIAIIDWSNADWTGIHGDRGPPEIDVAVFLMSMFNQRVFGPWRISGRHELARHFLATYATASPQGLSIDTLRTTVTAIRPGFTRLTRRVKGSLRALGYRPSAVDLYFFLRRLSRDGFAARS